MSDRLAQLLKLHQADPADPFLSYGIALEYAKAGEISDALSWLDRTLEADALYCYAYFQKAKLLDAEGESAAARAAGEAGLAAARKAGDQHAEGEIAELLASIDTGA